MAMKEIVIKIDKKGGVTVEPTKGYSGKECLKATADIEAALGKLEARKDKPEMYKEPEQHEHIKTGG